MPGRDVVTHLDARLQARTEAALVRAVASARADRPARDTAAAVVVDVTNGAVVAAASYPSYDPAVFSGGISSAELARLTDERAGTPLRSRLTAETFPPASTFKVISVPAAVNAGARLDGTYDCSPNVSVGGRVFNNFESRGYGPIDLHRALVVSCDTVFYRLAYAAWLAQGGLAAPVTRRRPLRLDGQGLRTRAAHRRRPAGRGGRTRPRPRLEGAVLARDEGRDVQAGEHRLPRGRPHRPGAGRLPHAARRRELHGRLPVPRRRRRQLLHRTGRHGRDDPADGAGSTPRSPTVARCGSRRWRPA